MNRLENVLGGGRSKGLKDEKEPFSVLIYQNPKGVLSQSPRECCSLATVQVFLLLEKSLQLQSVVIRMILRI